MHSPLPTSEVAAIDAPLPSAAPPSGAPAICVQLWHEVILPWCTFFVDLLPPAFVAHFPCTFTPPPEPHEVPSLSPMRLSVALRRKLGRGANYNLRLLIRGDLQTGKTQLWRRLQGLGFAAELPTTRTLGTVHLDWTCERSPDVVKVEAWDVVDADLTRSAREPPGGSLTFAHSQPGASPRSTATLDVWRGAHACVCTFDPRKRWTFAYAQRLLGDAPAHVPVLLLANFADLLDDAPPSAPPPAPPPAQPPSSSPHGGCSASGGSTDGSHTVPWCDVEQAARDETARTGRVVVCVRGSTADCRGLAAVHAFIQLPYYARVRAAMSQACADADAGLARAEKLVRAVASGEPFHDFLDGSSPPVPVAAGAGAPTDEPGVLTYLLTS